MKLTKLMEFYFEEYFKTKYMEFAITCWERGDEESMWQMLLEWAQHKHRAAEIFKNEDNLISMILIADGSHKTGSL